ncbi:MAG TPA: AbrB/MazE/SpoVT family DNA-binding domain-containing protein [Candidimonas sp.]|nr:AbrB/MazE/SpoVT family DNA-binding domain-containing protein [Candidimonas sp.]
MRGVIKKWGNSAAVRLPSSMMKTLKVDLESIVDIRVERGCIIIEPIRAEEYLLSQLLGGIKTGNVHAEIDFGAADT